ncbi:hypothetical protein V6N13_009500 [Hibiscus sabdariffa]|uniref:Uncharacterized protein n=1 Tax=Hibiscus sabdariffa TaxID=183260 RepID=A0ABR2ATW1_9ROSI
MSRPLLLVFSSTNTFRTAKIQLKKRLCLLFSLVNENFNYLSTNMVVDERNIQKLNEQVRSLQEQLLQCKVENEVTNRSGSGSGSAFALTELEQHPMLDD